MSSAGQHPSQSAPSLAEAFDWRAGRTWLVFLGLAVGHGFVAGAIPPVARVFPLYILQLSDSYTVESVTVLVSVGAMGGWLVLLAHSCRSLRLPEPFSKSPEAIDALRRWRRSLIGWLLVLIWLPVGMSVAYGVGFVCLHLTFGTFDIGKTHGLLMALLLCSGWLTLPGFMDRYAARR